MWMPISMLILMLMLRGSSVCVGGMGVDMYTCASEFQAVLISSLSPVCVCVCGVDGVVG